LISVSVSACLLFFRLILPVLPLAIIAVALGVLRVRSASPSLDRSSLQSVTVQSGPMICRVEGLGTLVPEDVRWLSAGTGPLTLRPERSQLIVCQILALSALRC